MADVTPIIPCRTLAHYLDTHLAPDACLISSPCRLLARVWELLTSWQHVADGLNYTTPLVCWQNAPLGWPGKVRVQVPAIV